MSNLVQAAEELEYVPKQDLVRMMEQGDMKYPPYLVLSEIQRRTQLENMVVQSKPNTTIAQEVVSEFAQPQGLAGMPQGMSTDIPLPPSSQTVYEDRGIPASGMAAGGYLGGGQMRYTGPIIYDEEGNELDGLEALRQSGGLKQFVRAIAMNEGGLTGYNMGGPLEQPSPGLIESIANKYRKPDGSFDTSRAIYDGIDGSLLAAATALTVVPTPATQFGGRILGGLRGALPLLKNIKIPKFLKGPEGSLLKNPRTYGLGFLGANYLLGGSDENATPNPPLDTDGNAGDADGKDKFVIKEGDTQPPPNSSNKDLSEIIRSQMGTLGLPPTAIEAPTKEQRDSEKDALIFSTLAKQIGSATDLSGIGQGLADATSAVIGQTRANRAEDIELAKSGRADVISEIQLLSSLQDIQARLESNDLKQKSIGQDQLNTMVNYLTNNFATMTPEVKEQLTREIERRFGITIPSKLPSTK
jgi:hypothetical protein|tara:strand:+ start:6680 stop:8092 length:1413 start_codon:yes stop_codon:yes gene_type:complete